MDLQRRLSVRLGSKAFDPLPLVIIWGFQVFGVFGEHQLNLLISQLFKEKTGELRLLDCLVAWLVALVALDRLGRLEISSERRQ